MKRLQPGGFTLIEIMITIVVVALLTTIALPSYLEHVAKGKRAEGRKALLMAMQAQERFYTTRTPTVADPIRYANTTEFPTLFGLAGTATVYSGENPALATGHYTLTVSNPAGCPIASCVQITATPNGSHAPDTKCGNLGLRSTGERTTTGTQSGQTAEQILAYCWGK